MFDAAVLDRATDLLRQLRAAHLMLATAESCTGGLIAGLFTEIAGSSDVVDRGFITYSNEAKADMLGVPAQLIATKGAVSQEVAIAMANGALSRVKSGRSGAVTVAVTGVAGPGGGSIEKPVGLVHLAVARTGHAARHRECRFGDIGRHQVRHATIVAALDLIGQAL